VHLSSLGHPVVGDTLYGAPRAIPRIRNLKKKKDPAEESPLVLPRNFLHAARLSFLHPSNQKQMDLEAPLPPQLLSFLETLRQPAKAD
jgi:23S rRNA pseudouridine1911/1915/1917 synthase